MLDAKLLEEIEAQAKLQFTNRQLATIAGIYYPHFLEMMEDENSPLCVAVTRGRLMAEAEVRKSIFELARSGSKDAQQMALNYFENLEIDNAA